MFNQRPKEREWISWLVVALWTISIFTFIPFARALQGVVSEQYGRDFFLVIVAVYLGLIFLLATLYLISTLKKLPLSNIVCLFFFFSLFAYWSWQLKSHPERALHFVQYGTLSILLYRALLHRFSDSGVYIIAVLGCFLVGTVDEIVQWFTPQRFFDYDDILIDGGASVLMQLAIITGIRPSIITLKANSKTLLICARLSIIQLILLSFCFINTPSLVNKYASQFEVLSYLKHNPSVMSEYGYRYEVPEIGRFFSRLNPQELVKVDQQRGEEVAKLIDQGYDVANYDRFLAKHHFLKDPLTYEVRVRLFRRDAYWGQANEAKPSSRAFREALTISFREHLILRNFYPESYQNSNRRLSQKDEQWMRENQFPDHKYISPVGGHLLTQLSQRQYLYLILSLLIILLITHRALKS